MFKRVIICKIRIVRYLFHKKSCIKLRNLREYSFTKYDAFRRKIAILFNQAFVFPGIYSHFGYGFWHVVCQGLTQRLDFGFCTGCKSRINVRENEVISQVNAFYFFRVCLVFFHPRDVSSIHSPCCDLLKENISSSSI